MLTENRNIIPVCIAWVPSKHGAFKDTFLKLFHDKLPLIKAFIGIIEWVGIKNI